MVKKIGTFKDFSDESIKCVFENENKGIIEMTLLFNKDDCDVVCVPTHHFCNLGCKMCHLTNNKLNKKMIPIKIEDFIEAFIMTITDNGTRRTDKRKLKISFMGVGEPLLNLQLIEDIYSNENKVKEYGYDNICYAISTMMPNDNILKLTEIVNRLNIPLKVHFSLHTPIDEERFELIPSTKVRVSEALEYLVHYREVIQKNDTIMREYTKIRSTNDPVEVHYTLIDGVNDGEKELNLVKELLSKYKITIKFIRFNPINDLKRSLNEELWTSTLKKEIPDLRVKVYSPPGREIGSSCGEFTKHYYHEEIETEDERKEFEEWKLKHQID